MGIVIKDTVNGYPVFYRDLGSVLDFQLNLVNWFAIDTSDQLVPSSCSVVAEDGSLVVDSYETDILNKTITGVISNGTAIVGDEDEIHFNIGTVKGLVDKRTFLFKTVDA